MKNTALSRLQPATPGEARSADATSALARPCLMATLVLCLLGCPAEDPGEPAGAPEHPAAAARPRLDSSPPATTGAGGGLASALASRAELREPTLEAWLSALVAAGDDGFVAVTEPEVKDELFLYQAQSSATTGFCLRGAIDPHRGAKASATWEARAARHGAPDLLRCTWTAEGMTFTLTETASALVVGVERATKPAPPLDRAALLRLIQAVVQTETPDHSWRYEISEGAELQSGTHLITTRGAPAVTSMETRDDRADILLVEGRAWFLFAKKIRQRIGFEPTDTWFRGSTRDVTSRS